MASGRTRGMTKGSRVDKHRNCETYPGCRSRPRDTPTGHQPQPPLSLAQPLLLHHPRVPPYTKKHNFSLHKETIRVWTWTSKNEGTITDIFYHEN